MIDFLPLWALLPFIVGIVILSLEIGRQLGLLRARRAEVEKESSVGAMVGATLGLLAFIMAFTFGMAGSRFDNRRQLLLDEVNAIGTAYLRTDLLEDPQQQKLQELFREYVDVRVNGVATGNFDQLIKRSEELHQEMWKQAVASGQRSPNSTTTMLFIQSLNEVIDLHQKRVLAGNRARIPDVIWLGLFAIIILAMVVMGYHAGLTGSNRSMAVFAFALAFSVVMYLIADLDRPRSGLIQVSQQPMAELRESMKPGK